MDGIHDLGGMEGFGPVAYDPEAPPFHDEWERRTFASFVATLGQGLYSMDNVRYAIERIDPEHYLSAAYYEKWLFGMETLLIEAGVLDETELLDRIESFESGDASVPDRLDPSLTDSLREGMRTAYQTGCEPREPAYGPGDEVRVRRMHPNGHTRCPRYLRGRRGVVDTVRGTYQVPDDDGPDGGAPVYSVRFDPMELWAGNAEGDRLSVDLWEPYLEDPADGGESDGR